MASVSMYGSANAAPTPRAGQIRPKQVGVLVALVGRLPGSRPSVVHTIADRASTAIGSP